MTTPSSLTLEGAAQPSTGARKTPVRASSGKGDVSFWFYIVVQDSLTKREVMLSLPVTQGTNIRAFSVTITAHKL